MNSAAEDVALLVKTGLHLFETGKSSDAHKRSPLHIFSFALAYAWLLAEADPEWCREQIRELLNPKTAAAVELEVVLLIQNLKARHEPTSE